MWYETQSRQLLAVDVENEMNDRQIESDDQSRKSSEKGLLEMQFDLLDPTGWWKS